MIYKIGKHQKDEKTGCLFALIYTLFPLKFFALLEGKNDFIALFFELCGIYYYLLKKYSISGFFFGLGINFKLFPVFCLIPIIIFLFKEKKYREILHYAGPILLVSVFTGIRFLLIDAPVYIDAILLNSSRPGDGLNYTYFLTGFRKQMQIQISDYTLSISYLFIYEIVGLFIVVFLIFFEKPVKYNIFSANLLMFMLLPIIMARMDMNSWLWVIPFLIFSIFGNNIDIEAEIKPKIIILLVLFVIFTIISILSLPDNFSLIFQPYENEGDTLHISMLFSRIDGKRAFGIQYYIFLVITGMYMIIFFFKDFRIRLLGMITLFHCLDVFNYYILEYFQLETEIHALGVILFVLRNLLLFYIFCRIQQYAKIKYYDRG